MSDLRDSTSAVASASPSAGAVGVFERARRATERRPWLISILLAVLFLPVKLYGFHLGYLNIHAARDWERGWQMMHGVQAWWHGPELLFGGAVPGFFFNLLAGLFQIPHRNPFFAAMGPPILFCISIGFFHDAARRFFRPRTALLAAVVYGVFPLGTLALRYLWNPSYLFLFSTLSFWCVARAIQENRNNFMAGALLAALLAAQLHLSGYSLVLSVVAMMFLLKRRPGWGWLALVAAIHLAFTAPYFVSEYNQGWPLLNEGKYHALSGNVKIMRIAPTHNFGSGVALQLLVKSPAWGQSEPFSYYERFYKEGGALGRATGWGCHLLSFGVLALFLYGGWLVARRSPRPERVDPATASFVRMCLMVFLAVCLPVLLWNPALGAEGRTDQPLRYYFIFWPAQFFVVALGIDALLRRPGETGASFRKSLTLWTGLFAAACILFTALFMNEAARTGKPFRYLFFDHWTVHALRDKVAVARYLRERHGLTEELFLTRVHTAGHLFHIPEESLDYEVRSAIENCPDAPKPDPSLYYFLFEYEEADRLAGEYKEIDLQRFGSLGLLVYRPKTPTPEWQVDPPVSWWWY